MRGMRHIVSAWYLIGRDSAKRRRERGIAERCIANTIKDEAAHSNASAAVLPAWHMLSISHKGAYGEVR